MFGISFEHILIVGVILLLIGPKKLPELGNTMGKAIKNFKDSIAGVEEASFKRLADEEKNKKNAPAETFRQEKPIATPVAQQDALSTDPASARHMNQTVNQTVDATKTSNT